MFEKLSFLINAILNPSELPSIISKKNKWKGENVINAFLLPMAALIAVEILITYILYTENFKIEVAIIRPLFFVIKSFIAFFFFSKLAVFVCEKFLQIRIEREFLLLILFLIYFTYMAVQALLFLLPSMFFIRFFIAYAYYQAWHIANSLFNIEENQKLQFTLIIPSMMLMTNFIVEMVVGLLVPNIPM